MIRIALCQVNLPVGDIDGNVERVGEWIEAAQKQGADLAVFPELSISGYPPEDLLLKPSFAEQAHAAIHTLAADIEGLVVLVGFPFLSGDLYNAAAIIADGNVAAIYRKRYLPNYSVFDEQRYFANGSRALVFDLNGSRVGVTVCEDLWYPGGPGQWAAMEGEAQLIVNLSASPYHRAKGQERERMFATRAIDNNCFIAFCNAVGGQDELVFDGHSLIIDPAGKVVARGRQFDEDLLVADLDLGHASRQRLHDPRWRQKEAQDPERVDLVNLTGPKRKDRTLLHPESVALLEPEAEVYRALVLGTADYFQKNGFRHAVLGLSGGIDSALALAIAVDAVGPDAVTAVSLPSRYTAQINREDAATLASTLKVKLLEIPIPEVVTAYDVLLSDQFSGTEPNIAEENIQARIRGNIVMALSNKFGWLVLTTGNKSEISVGYATLYGDMAGGFSILKDVLKTWVYRLAHWVNRERGIIPQRIIDKQPSAELRENQLDTDNLPPYDVLDGILEAYVEEDRTPTEIAAVGFDPTLVAKIVEMVDRAEYKRRQAAPGIRISTRAFGKDRRLPITNQYRGK